MPPDQPTDSKRARIGVENCRHCLAFSLLGSIFLSFLKKNLGRLLDQRGAQTHDSEVKSLVLY